MSVGSVFKGPAGASERQSRPATPPCWLWTALCIQLLSVTCCAGDATALKAVTSSYSCKHEDAGADKRACVMHNLILHNGNLTYLYSGPQAPQLPPILVHWNEEEFASIAVQHVGDLDATLLEAPVSHIEQAVLYYVPWAYNYYHAFGEGLVGMHIQACQVFGHCDAATLPGPRLFRIEHKFADQKWASRLPALDLVSRCIAPAGVLHIGDETLRDQVIIFGSAALGIGPSNRAYGGQTGRIGFRDVYKRPEPWIMDAFRHRIASCLNFPIQHLHAGSKLNITIINRGDDLGRHILNTRSILKKIWETYRQQLGNVRILRPEEESIQETLAATAASSIVILTHGAQCANMMFLPKGAVVVEYLWHSEVFAEHNWAIELLQDLGMPLSFLGLHNTNPHLGEWQRETFIYQEKWEQLSAEDRLSFFENGELPEGKLDHLFRKWHMNFNLDWQLLKPALDKAVLAIRTETPIMSLQQPETAFAEPT